MKKSLFIFSLSVSTMLFAACGGGSKSTDNADSTKAASENAVAHSSEAANDTTVQNSTGTEKTGSELSSSSSKGAQLIAKNDCLTCHKEHEKLIGPAYADVAKKYSSSDVDKLADKVIKGGSGSWGEVAMTPHPSLSTDDAKEMVKYILSIK